MAAWNPDANEIFLKALEITSPNARRTFLDEACRQDAQLRSEVEALIAADEQAGSFLESPPLAVTAVIDASKRSERPGLVIGPYKLLEQIGTGGMGNVFMAEQQRPVRRKVAIKLIKQGMDTREFIARFEAERQALAVMDHPNIARVLDAGATESGRPYFVMELVRGIPITTYCDDNNLSIDERLELFGSICQAIQHAHTKGIIHRDIKPTNVLVTRQDGRPMVKVIDFGVAKAIGQQLTEKTLFTNFGQMIGTPLYMSPEQAEQSGVDIDTRSDIYSLGVLLYELLTGTTPVSSERLNKAAFDEIRRIIREVDPQTPSQRISGSMALPAIAAQRHIEPARLGKLVRGELDWIVMKALEKDRGRRYETANALAADVLHYLHDEPVNACPPSATYRFSKFARRNRVALTTTTLVAMALVMGTIVSSWQAIRAETARTAEAQQRQIAEEQRIVSETERTEAERQRVQADANFQRARNAVNEYFTIVSESTLFDVPGLETLRKQLLEASLRFYEQTAVERTNDPAVLVDLATTYMRVAMISHTVDRNDDAIKAIDQSLAVIDRLRNQFPEARDQHRRLAGSWQGLRRTRTQTEMPKNATTAFQSISRLIDTWETFSREFPDEPAFRSDLAAWYYLTGDLLASAGQVKEGVAFLERASATLKTLIHDDSNHPQYLAELARTHEQLALRLPKIERQSDAEIECREGLVLREKLVLQFPQSPHYRSDLNNSLRQLIPYLKNRDPIEANRLRRRILDSSESLVRDYPNVPRYRLELAEAKRSLLLSCVASGNKEDIDEVLKLLNEWVANHGADPEDRRSLGLAIRDVALGLPDRTELIPKVTDLHRLSLRVLDELAKEFPNEPDYHEQAGHAHRYLGWLAKDVGRSDEAIDQFAQGVAEFQNLGDRKNGNNTDYYRDYQADTLTEMGIVLATSGKVREAEIAFDSSVEVYQTLIRKEPSNQKYPAKMAACERERAKILVHQQNLPEALAAAQRAAHLAPNDFETHKVLLDVLNRMGDREQTLAVLRKNVAEMPDSQMAHYYLGVALESRSQHAEAIAEFETTSRLHPDWELPHMCTANNHAVLGNWDKAADEYSKTFEMDPSSWWKIVASLRSKGELGDREKILRRLIAAADNRANESPVRFSRGALHRELDQFDLAIADFSWVINQQPDWTDTLVFRGDCHFRKGELEKAEADYSKAAELCGNDAGAMNNLAWRLATSPEANAANANLAVQLATKAIELDPVSTLFANTLGVARYRTGNWQQAVEWLDKSITLRNGGDSFDWFFLCMAHRQLDHQQEARQWQTKAIEWMDANKPNDPELLRFRTEAEKLMNQEIAVEDQ